MRAPVLHTHIEDVLPDDHPLAFDTVYCEGPECNRMLHAFNNECMQTWVETGKGNYCIWCFMRVTKGPEVLEEEWGLPDGKAPR